jgi:hypothetical protein
MIPKATPTEMLTPIRFVGESHLRWLADEAELIRDILSICIQLVLSDIKSQCATNSRISPSIGMAAFFTGGLSQDGLIGSM